MTSRFYILIIALLAIGCQSDKKENQKWYKGNLHTHSYWSDGDEFPEMIMDWYKSHSYDFVGLSDHNILAEGEKWKLVPKANIYEQGFEKYLNKYGEQWVTYRIDTGRTHVKLKTLNEYRTLFEDDSFLIIRSEEITDGFEGKPIHINATNVQTLIQPQGGNSVSNVMQRNIDQVLNQREQTGQPMFPHINHPNFGFAVSIDDMIQLKGERFFEVYNGHPLVNNYGDSLHPGTEEMWDKINIAYAKRGQPLMYGLATDDSHNYHQIGSQYSNPGRGWVMVLADSLSPSSIIRSMEAGDFYSSTGVVLDDISFKDNKLTVTVQPEAGVTYTIRFIGVKAGEASSSILKEMTATTGTFSLTEDIVFVRAKVVSSKIKVNPFQEGELETAWIQPVQII